ncbi:TSUP family transporter [Nesterenkonia sp.]|uniref:TSUP family transporter n=1 Tax=Nesterenkonia sp. TaxID=704201 RepID=UPI002608F150|nr:TSUP family transporter [Nesterenkonia sp.]
MSGELLMAITIIGLVILAAGLQRLTGMGFAMMMAPFLVVMIGPHGGVMLTNVLSLVAPILMLPMVWRDIQWRRLAIIVPVSLAVMPLFGWMAAASPQGPLYIAVASLVLLGLSISLIISRISAAVDGPWTRVLTGVGTGGGTVLAGVGGPAMTVYAVVSRWEVRGFAATLQPLWLVMSAGGFLTKLIFSGNEVPSFPLWFWAGCALAILVGLWGGTVVRRWVSDTAARRIVIALAFAGALISLAMGIRSAAGL